MSLSPGARLGPYEILAPLGAGGMGEVWRARDTRLGREVAVKVLPAAFAQDPERLARFEREAKAVAALSHPNILALHDFGTSEGTAYAVTELLEGGTLRARLGDGALPVRRAVEVAVQIAHGLAAAHDKGIVHRDLKPENLWVGHDGQVKILDFGLARQTAAEGPGSSSIAPTEALATGAGLVLGTVGYMSPEQVRGGALDHRSDLFSFGAVLYELLSGKRAFQGETPADTMSAILKEEPPELAQAVRDLPPGLERIVTRCLEKQPAARFQSAHDLAFALEALVSHSSSGTPALDLGVRPTARRTRLVAALGLAGIGIAVAAYLLGRAFPTRSGVPGLVFAQKSFGRQAIFQARFAPDGQTVVLSAAKEGNTPELYVIRPDSPEPRPLGIPALHLLSISSKGELAVLVGARYLGHHRLFTGTLARMPIEGGAPRPLLEDVRDADWTPDGSGLAVIREHGGRYRLEYPIGRVLFESAGYLSDPRFSPKGDRLVFMEHPSRYDDRGTVNVVDLSGRAKVLTGVFWGEEGLAWSAGGREALFAASMTGGASEIYAVDLAGRQHTVLGVPGEVTMLDVGPKGRWLILRDEQPTSILVKAPGAKAERDLSWLEGAIGPVLSADGRTLLFTDEGMMAGNNYNACVRGTDGSPIIRLGEGVGIDLSRDGAAVLAVVPSDQPKLMSYPTGAGDPVRLDRGQLARITTARWLPDRRQALVSGAEPGKGPRCYLLDVRSGAMRPVTPPGTLVGTVAPDGRALLARDSRGWALYGLEGGGSRAIASLSPEDDLIRWSPDGRSVFAYRSSQIPLRVDQVDLATGRRTLFAELSPTERAGLLSFLGVSLADDLKSYAYCFQRHISTLYQVEGAR